MRTEPSRSWPNQEHPHEILRQASVALRGLPVTMWEARSKGGLAIVLRSTTEPRHTATALELHTTLRSWGIPVSTGSQWLSCYLEDIARWCLAPVRGHAAAPPPGGVERRAPARMTLELAALSLGLVLRVEGVSTATLDALVNALEAKDPYLRGHSTRVADLSAAIGARLELPDEQVEQIRIAGRLHDVGKIGIREAVLHKHGPLPPEEYEHVKQHAAIGSQILAPLTQLGPVIAYVRGHHERWDGGGYPDRLSGEAIPIGARVIGAAEVYDALSSARPYQERLSPEDAVQHMAGLVGTVLDPKVHAALAAVVSRGKTLDFLDEGTSGQP